MTKQQCIEKLQQLLLTSNKNQDYIRTEILQYASRLEEQVTYLKEAEIKLTNINPDMVIAIQQQVKDYNKTSKFLCLLYKV